MKWYMGCDVGLDGAIAFYNPFSKDLIIEDMPTLNIKVNNKNKRQVDLYRLAQIVDAHKSSIARAMIEAVSSAPGMGCVSAFNFGFSAGVVQMVVASNFIPMGLVSPRVWKRVMGVTADKDTSFRAASRLLPQHGHMWNLKKHDGRAEAALLAVYCAQTDKARSSVGDLL